MVAKGSHEVIAILGSGARKPGRSTQVGTLQCHAAAQCLADTRAASNSRGETTHIWIVCVKVARHPIIKKVVVARVARFYIASSPPVPNADLRMATSAAHPPHFPTHCSPRLSLPDKMKTATVLLAALCVVVAFAAVDAKKVCAGPSTPCAPTMCGGVTFVCLRFLLTLTGPQGHPQGVLRC